MKETVVVEKKEAVTIILFKNQFKEEDVFQDILLALNRNPSDTSIIINIPTC